MKYKPTVIFFNDNHCVISEGRARFEDSTFHLFLRDFPSAKPILSSPCCRFEAFSGSKHFTIDDVVVLPRNAYGTAKFFYKRLPIMIILGAINLYCHVRSADVVVMVLPACYAPLTYLIARALRKPIVAYVVGNVAEVVESSEHYTGLIGFLASLAASWEAFFTKYVSRRCETMVLGTKMMRYLKDAGAKPRAAMTSLVKESMVSLPTEQKALEGIKLVSAGRLAPEKGIDICLQAVARIAKMGRDIQYSIVGGGPFYNRLKKISAKLGIENQVEFLGRRSLSEIFESIFPTADIFVLPSLSEGTPKVILEAMAAGLPIIACRVGGVPDLLSENEERGWLVEPGDVESLVRAILNCADNPPDRMKRLNAATKFIMQHTMEAEAERFSKVILELYRKNYSTI